MFIATQRRPALAMRVASLLAGGMFFAYLAAIVSLEATSSTSLGLRSGLMIGGALLAAAALAYAAFRAGRPSTGAGFIWALLAMAHVLAAAGEQLWAMSRNTGLSSDLADGLHLAYHLLLVFALLLLATGPGSTAQRFKLLLDVSILVLASSLVFWVLWAPGELASAGAQAMRPPRALAYPLGDVALFFALGALLLRMRLLGQPALLLAAGALALATTDVLVASETIVQAQAGAGWLDLGWLLAYALMGLAGVLQSSQARLGAWAGVSIRPPGRRPAWRQAVLYFPFGLVLAAYGLVIWSRAASPALSAPTLVIGVAGLVVLVLVRQAAAVRESGRQLQFEQTQRDADAVLLDLSRQLLSAPNEAEACRGAVEIATRALGMAWGLVVLADDNGQLWVRASSGWPEELAQSLRFSRGSETSHLGRTLARAQPVAVRDYAAANPVSLEPVLAAEGVRSGVSAPLLIEGQPAGAILLNSPAPRGVRDDEVRLLSLIANQTSAGIERLRLFAVKRRHVDELTVLHAVATAAAEAVTEDELIEKVTRIVGDTLFSSHLGVMMVDAQTSLLRSHPSYRGDYNFTTPLGQGITGHVALTGRPARVADVRADPRYVGADAGTLSELCVPMMTGERAIGVINVESKSLNAFTEDDERLLLTIAHQTATAIEKLRLFGRLFHAEQQRAGELEAVRQASLGLTASLELEAVLRAILQSTSRLVPTAQEAFIYLYHPTDDGNGRLTFGASRTLPGRLPDFWQPRPGGFTHTVARQGEAMVVSDTRQHPLLEGMPAEWGGAIVGLPLKIGSRVVGVMNVTYSEARGFPDWELRVLRLLGDQAAIAIENARLFQAERRARQQAEALREVAGTLTGSLGREQLLRLLLEQLARVVSFDSASVMLFVNERMMIVAQHGFQAEAQQMISQSTSHLRHIAEVVETGRPMIIADTHSDERWHKVLGGEYIRCWLGVPLVAQGRVIGLLNLDKVEPHFYTAQDAELTAVFANHAAAAIESARLFEAERRQLSLSQTLQAVGALLTAQMSLKEVFENIFDLLAHVIEYDSVSVQMLEADGSMWLAAGRGFPDIELARENVRYVSERRPSAQWLEKRVVVIPDTQADENWIASSSADYVRSWVGAALVVKGQLVGILATDNATPNAYDAAIGETVLAFANQAAVAIENARLFEESQRQTRALAGLYNTALATGSVLETDVLLARLYEQVSPLLAPDTFVVTLYDPRLEELEVALAIEGGQFASDVVPAGRLPVSQGLTGWVVRTRRSLLVPDLQSDPLPVPPRHGQRPARSWLGVPLIVHERIIGAASVQSFRPNAFDPADQRFLESVASQVAIAIENARLYAEISARASELSRLYAAAQDLGARLEPQAVLQELARHLTEAVGATSGYVTEINRANDSFVVLAEYWSAAAGPEERVSDVGSAYPLDSHPSIQRALASLTIAERQVDDPYLAETERTLLQRYGVKSALVVPIVSRGEVLGTAEIWESRRKRIFQVAERRLLQTLCQHAAGVIENARLFEGTLQHADEVTTASEILHLLNATSDVVESFPTIASAIKSITGCERVSIATLDAHRTKITLAALDVPRDELPRGAQFPITASAAADDVLAGNIHLTPDLAAERHFPAERALYEAGFRSRLNLPLRVSDQVIGSLNLVWYELSGYLQANLPLLAQLVDAIALAVEKTRLFDETRRRDAILEALAYGGGKLLLANHPDEVMPEMLAQLGSAAGVSRAYIFYNHQTPDGELIASLLHDWLSPGRESDADWHDLPYLAAGFERWQQVLSAGRPLDGLVRDFPEAERSRLERMSVQSLAAVPIFSGGEWWGWLGFDDCEQERIWSAAEIEALKGAAGALGAFLSRQRIEAAEREQRALAEALRDTAAVLNSTLDLDEVLDRILADVGHVVPHDSANIMLIEAGVARVVRTRDLHGRFPEGTMLAVRYAVNEVANLRYMLEHGQPAIIVNVKHYPGWVQRAETAWIASSVGAPIKIKGQVIGFITLDSSIPGFFVVSHAERLQAFAHQAGLAIENAQLYASIRQHAEELEQRVVERTSELAEANERLKELDQLKDQFISNVSHELRTPLTNIKLHLGLLEKRGPEVLPRYLPTLQRETERLRRLIEDLLDLARLQTHTESIRREPQLLDDLLSDVLTLHAARAEAKGLDLRHDPSPAGLQVPVDRAQMLQVFTNLIGNAVAYTPPDGLVVVSSVPMRMGSTPGVNIRFFNDGPLIPPEDLPHLFRRFYRGKTAHDSGEPGTGLGLSICREIVERHGGQIDVTSVRGQGTAFTIWLPLT
jgi:GAF domain-containing protein